MRRRNYQRNIRFFRGAEVRRLMLMVFLLAALGMALRQTSNPASWQWLTRGAAASETATATTPAPRTEQPVEAAPAPEDDPAETEAIRRQFEAVTDFAPLAPEEMPAYWRLMKWAGSQSFDALKARAQRGVLYTQLWDEPARFRGKPIALRLHLRRSLSFPAPKNSAGVKTVYEAWGHTDESRSLPYLVVFADPPAGFPLGDPIREEGLFVGYFFKNMGYQSFDKQRGAPVLIGRLERVAAAPAAVNPAVERTWFWWTLGIGVAVMAAMFLLWALRRRAPAAPATAAPAAFDAWLADVERAPEQEPQTDGRREGG